MLSDLIHENHLVLRLVLARYQIVLRDYLRLLLREERWVLPGDLGRLAGGYQILRY